MKVPTNASNSAADMSNHIGRLQGDVLAEVAKHHTLGATCDEIEVALKLSHQTISPRVYELHRRGMIIDSGLRRKTRSGRAAIVWVTAAVGKAPTLKAGSVRSGKKPLKKRTAKPVLPQSAVLQPAQPKENQILEDRRQILQDRHRALLEAVEPLFPSLTSEQG